MATMSRQHYEMLAQTLGNAVAVEACEGGGAGSLAASAAYRVALAVADSLKETNPAYNRGRFMDAVGEHANNTAEVLSGSALSADRGAGFCLHDALAQRNG
jgi:hypothetical protein